MHVSYLWHTQLNFYSIFYSSSIIISISSQFIQMDNLVIDLLLRPHTPPLYHFPFNEEERAAFNAWISNLSKINQHLLWSHQHLFPNSLPVYLSWTFLWNQVFIHFGVVEEYRYQPLWFPTAGHNNVELTGGELYFEHIQKFIDDITTT